MAIKEVLRLVVEADTRGAVKGVEDFGNRSERAVSKSEKAIDRFGNRLTSIGAGMIGFGAVAIAGLASTADAASDLNEVASKSATVFGSASDEVDKFASDAAKIGLSKRAALEAASGFGNLFDQLGFATDASAEMSIQLTGLASDFASFHNADITEVIEAQTAAFRGEYDSLQRFVPTINAAAVQQQAMAETGKANAAALTEAEKAAATYTLMIEGAGAAQGDFARTSDSAANQQRQLSANFENLKASIGQGVLPAMKSLLNVANDVIGGLQGINSVTDGTAGKIATIGSVGLVAAGGLSVVVGQVIKMRQNLGSLVGGVSSFTQKIGGLKGALIGGAGLAGALFVASEVLEGFNRKKEEAERLAQRYADALGEEGKAQRDALDEITATDESLDSIRRTLRGADADVDVFQKAIESSNDELGDMQDILATTPRVQHQLEEALRDSAEGGSELAAELLKVAENGDAYGNSTRDLVSGLVEQRDAFREGEEIALDFAHASDEAKGGTDDLTGSVDEQVESLEEAKSALEEYNEELKASTDPIFAAMDAITGNRDAQLAYRDAQLEVLTAQRELDTALKDHGGNSAEAAEATRKLEDAQRGLTDAEWGTVESAAEVDSALASLKDAVERGDVSTDSFRSTLRQWVDQGFLTQRQADLAAVSVGGLASEAEEADKQRVDIPVRTNGAVKSRTELGSVRDAAHSIPRSRNTHVSTTGTQYAIGQLDRVAQRVNDIIRNGNVHVSVGGGGGLTLHEGGVVGGRPGQELLALVQAGEEMLTADDPRHVKNLGKLETTAFLAATIPAPSFVSGASTTATYVDNRQFNVHTGADPQGVVEALKRYERSNGPIPVTVR